MAREIQNSSPDNIMTQPLVKNASDTEQVKTASVKESIGRDQELNDLREILALDGGRRFVWRLLCRASVFKSVLNENPILMGHSSGAQDFGHFITDEVIQASPDRFMQMMKEAAVKDNKPV